MGVLVVSDPCSHPSHLLDPNPPPQPPSGGFFSPEKQTREGSEARTDVLFESLTYTPLGGPGRFASRMLISKQPNMTQNQECFFFFLFVGG